MGNNKEIDARVIWVGPDEDFRCVAKTYYSAALSRNGLVRFYFESVEGEDALGNKKWKTIGSGVFGDAFLKEIDYVEIGGPTKHISMKLWKSFSVLVEAAQDYIELAPEIIDEHLGT